MRDYERELPKDDERVIYKSERGMSVGRRKPYNELLYAIEEFAKIASKTQDGRKELRKLAWFLGDSGQTQACEVIMKHAAGPTRVYPYGYY